MEAPSTLPNLQYDSSAQTTGEIQNLSEIVRSLNLGEYSIPNVANLSDDESILLFNTGYRLMMAYQHELASHCLNACLERSPNVALAHGLIALCHSPNYNFKGKPYYDGTYQLEELTMLDKDCAFPSQHVADRHSAMGAMIVETIKTQRRRKKDKSADVPDLIGEVEARLLSAIRILTSHPGIDSSLSEEVVGRPYANAMRKIHKKYPKNPDVAYLFCESLMVLNAWKLYEFPSGRPVSPDVDEIRSTLEQTLVHYPRHPGLCHMYVHLSEMSAQPALALAHCAPLREDMPDAGHLIHMPSHVDVLVGDYESCVRSNCDAIRANRRIMEICTSTAGFQSFYFGYIAHDYHMAVYGALLGGMEAKALSVARELVAILGEDLFRKSPPLVGYLEAYLGLDIDVLIRFGRWQEIIDTPFPVDKKLMLSRTATLLFGRAIALAITGQLEAAAKEADRYDSFVAENDEEAHNRILHNNSVASLFAVNAAMMRGELLYRQGKHAKGFALLRRAVMLQDTLNYDEPWGKMQPIRHALGGLLLEQGEVDEATTVFRENLTFHPLNPWALVGLIRCLREKGEHDTTEITLLEEQLQQQRNTEWADFDVVVACECCQKTCQKTAAV